MKSTSNIFKSGEDLSEEILTGLFSRAFSQPLILLEQADASLSSYAVFWCVAFNEGATQVEVANLTGLSAKTVSRVISQLGEARTGRGWIKQKLDEKDRRVRRLMLSGKGRSVYARMIGDIRTFNRGLEA